VTAPDDAILVVDSVFAMRPEYDAHWEYRIWLEVEPDIAVARGIGRDLDAEGIEEATSVRRDRYGPAEEIYIAETDPVSRADLVIDNDDFANPRIIRRGSG
jgi:uridine kinase